MSEGPDRESKTEEATPRKLEQAREKGDGAKTMDLASFATLSASAAVVLLAGGWLSRNMAAQLLPFIAQPDQMVLEGSGGVQVLKYALMAGAPALLFVMAATAFAGVSANLVQSGFRLTPDKLKPDFSKLDPRKGLERLFGPDALMQFAKSIVKVIAIGVIGWVVLKPAVEKFASLSALEPAAMLPYCVDILKRLVFSVAAFTLVIAGADFLWQRQRFLTRMRMTREEVKEDYKQTEGDPHVKARQRQLRHERARRRMMQAVPEATVVIMNPTHYAVALKYEQGEHAAPMCVAKGLDSLALKIRSVAEESGVPVIEDPPLARALYAAVEIEEMIPPAHFEAVAKIIGFIMGSAHKRPAHH
jgi:flagellar biosynthetic protein FlhB